jgi:hypothetical protein
MCDRAIILIFWAGARRRAPRRQVAPLERTFRIDRTRTAGRTRNPVKSEKSDTGAASLSAHAVLPSRACRTSARRSSDRTTRAC